MSCPSEPAAFTAKNRLQIGLKKPAYITRIPIAGQIRDEFCTSGYFSISKLAILRRVTFIGYTCKYEHILLCAKTTKIHLLSVAWAA